MLVKHLIEKLLRCNPDYEIYTEGCDCEGNSYAVEQLPDEKQVMIRRDEHFTIKEFDSIGFTYNLKSINYDNKNDGLLFLNGEQNGPSYDRETEPSQHAGN